MASMLLWRMAATARLLEPIERLFEEAPSPSMQFAVPANPSASPKAIAEQIVQDAERASKAWISKFSTTVESLRENKLGAEFWEAMGVYISAQLDLLKLKIEGNRAESEAALKRVPLPAPLAGMRVIIRGLDRVYTHQHAALVDIYYRAMAEVWDQDPEAIGGTEVANTAEEVADFFKQVRGS